MPLTRRARRRLTLLGVSCLVVIGLGVGAWFLQQSVKDARAQAARQTGLAAVAAGDWEAALPELGLAAARNQDDFEVVMALAESRSWVAEPNNRHLVTAMGYYTRACELAKRPGATKEQLQEALLGRARMELANRAIVRLEETALGILELDQANATAIDYLFEIRKIRGEFLPDSTELLVRGDRTDAAWLKVLRDAEERAALRWALERLILDPYDIDRRERVLAVLREGGAEDLQRLRDGVLRESTMDLVRAWVAEAEPSDPMPQLVLALEHLRRNELVEARTAVAAAEAIDLKRADLILRAATIREALQTPEDLARATALIDAAEAAAESNPRVAMNIALRHWNAGRSPDAFRVLDRMLVGEKMADEQIRLDLLANAALLAVLDGRTDAEARLAAIDEELATSTVDPQIRDLLRQVVVIGRTAIAEDPSDDELAKATTAATALAGNPLVQTAMGDILDREGFTAAATEAWERAGDLVGQRSLPIGRRAVRGLLDDQSVEEGFRQALRYAGGTRSLASVIALCEAWLALEAAGLKARDVEPSFTEWSSPLGLAKTILDDLEPSDTVNSGVLPLVAEAAVREGDITMVDRMIDLALKGAAKPPVLVRLAGIAQSADLNRVEELADAIRASEEGEQYLDQVTVIETASLRRASKLDEALALARSRFADRDDENARRFLGLELMDYAAATDGAIDEAFEILLAVPTGDRILQRMQELAIARNRPDLSIAIVDRARTLSGPESNQTVQAEAGHVLGFEGDDADSVRKAVLRVDPIVSSGNATADLEVALVRLLQLMDPPQVERSIEVLTESTRRRPGRFDTAVLLIDLLQQAGRFDEAEEQVQALYRRRDKAPPAIQRLIPTLLAGQGSGELVAKSACELAERTGRPIDKLECARALYRNGDIDAGDAVLDELIALEVRPPAIDIEAAARLVRRGQPEEAIDLLRGSTAFATDVDRDLALAGLLLQMQRWSELAEVLGQLPTTGNGAAEAFLMRAILALNGPDRDPSSAMVALDAAVELAPDDAGVLRRNATTRLADPDLRATARDAIDLLGRLRSPEAELMRLAFDVSPDGETFTPTDEHIARAQALVELQATSRPAWVLALEILGAAYDQSMGIADPMVTSRRGEQLVELAEAAMGRFPGDSNFPVQLSQIHLVLGNTGDALAAAREGLRRAGNDARLGNAIPVALVESRMGRPEAVIRTLSPYRAQIESDPAAVPRSWALLFQSLIATGAVDEAWNLYRQIRSGQEPQVAVDWLIAAEAAPPAAARKAVEKAGALLPPGQSRLAMAGALTSVYRRTGDAETRQAAEAVFDGILAVESNPALEMQVAISRIGLDEKTDPDGALQRYRALVEELPAGTVDRLKRFESLSDAERRQVAPIANAAIMAMNNYAAVTATAILDGRVAPASAAPELARALQVSEDLAQIMPENPEILDTRAMVALAAEDGASAVQLAEAAVRQLPQRPGFRFTLAKSLALEGRGEEAAMQAREAIRLLRREPEPDEAQIQTIQRFLDGQRV